MNEQDLHCWTPELRRAVMAARPEFFGWPAGERLSYRVKPPDADREAIVAALLRAHGTCRPEATAKLESRGRIGLALQNRINEWPQPVVGAKSCCTPTRCAIWRTAASRDRPRARRRIFRLADRLARRLSGSRLR
ncbi:MAG: hypothetical protein ABMA14_26360, partial [Hyphomonadaceae bacterium]